MNVAFLGLGAMGEPMARHIAAKGFSLSVWNRTAARADALRQSGATVARDPAEAVQQADVVLLCVSADADVLAVVDQVTPAMRAGSVLIDTSTVSADTAREAAARLATRSVAFLDAPLSGGVEGARNGRLSVMVGGDAATLERARPVLECFAARITHMGDVGAGQATKAVNQVMVAGITEAVCEALAFGEKLGLPRERLLGVLGAGAANSWFLEKRGASMLEERFDSGFKLGLLHKDLGIVRAMAQRLGARLPVVDAAFADYQTLLDEGRFDEEISALIRLKRRLFP
jgi:3-hydroxyisobutyrate dehydrogenase